MRYQIGQVVPVVAFNVGTRYGIVRPLPWRDNIAEIRIKLLTVKEHHRAPEYWDTANVLAHDGFILEDSEGRVWHNQFPKASYGQLDCSADFLFRQASVDSDSQPDDKGWFYRDLLDFLEDLLRGAKLLGSETSDSTKSPEEKQYSRLLTELFNEVSEKYTKQSGNRIAFTKAVLSTAHGDVELDDFFTCRIVKASEAGSAETKNA